MTLTDRIETIEFLTHHAHMHCAIEGRMYVSTTPEVSEDGNRVEWTAHLMVRDWSGKHTVWLSGAAEATPDAALDALAREIEAAQRKAA